MIDEWDGGNSIEENSLRKIIDKSKTKKLIIEVKKKHSPSKELDVPFIIDPVNHSSPKSAPAEMENDKYYKKGPVMKHRALCIIPKVNGDREDDFDQCKYGAKTLGKSDSVVNKGEVQLLAPLTQDQLKVKQQVRRGKLHRKSRSVMNPASILKRKDTISQAPVKKKVQFNTKKTVFRYCPQK